MAFQQHYSCCKQQLVFVLLVIVFGSCLLFADAAHQEVVEVEQHQRYSKPRRLRDRSQLYQVIDDPNNTNKQRGLLNDVVLDETSVEFQHEQQRRLKSEKIIKKVEKAVYNKEAKSDKASKVYARKSVKSFNEKVGKVEKGQFAKKFQKRGGSKSEKESKGQFAKKSFKRSKNEKEMNSKSVGLKLKKARQATPSFDTIEIMMSSMSMDFSMSM